LESTAGAILVVASIAALWIFVPKCGQQHLLMRLRFMQSLVPLAIFSRLAFVPTIAISGR
jgi:hypothetical protein